MQCFEAERKIITRQIRTRLGELQDFFYWHRQPIGAIEYCVTGKGKGPERAPDEGWQPFALKTRWGGFDQTTWFRMSVTVPKEIAGMPCVALIRPGGESLVYVNGVPFQGLDARRDELFLTNAAEGGETYHLVLESVPSVEEDIYHIFEYADVAGFDSRTWDAYWDFAVGLEITGVLPPDSVVRMRLLELIERTLLIIDLNRPGSPEYYESLQEARAAYQEGMRILRNDGDNGNLVLVGQSHIDTAWLWPLRETRRKCGRTFATVLRLMERHPEFLFMASQPAQLEWIKEHYPETYEGIKRRVAEGRWEPIGGMYVESDCNVPCGESFVRQFLYGNRFFRKEFGVHTRTAWLPDTFGDSWALPQILRKAQIDVFVTNKINWSEFTTFPYDFFLWEGPDGTRIPCVIPPSNYDPPIKLPNIVFQWEQFAQKDIVDVLPFSYGYGDGGGGPTSDMIETGKRLRDVAGIPKCRFGRMQDCLDEMLATCAKDKLPVWNGELYLELHRGCQTTQARTKRNNRKSELLLRDVEFLNSLAVLHNGVYEREKIDTAWKTVLLNQFHDILPGSSVNEVYAVADKDYAQIRQLLSEAWESARAHICSLVDAGANGDAVVVFNTLPWVRTDVVLCHDLSFPEGSVLKSPRGEIVCSQKTADGSLLFLAEAVSPMGYTVFDVVRSSDAGSDVEPGSPFGMPRARRSLPARLRDVEPGSPFGMPRGELHQDPEGNVTATLENDFVQLTVDNCGRLTSLFDRRLSRECLADGRCGNVLQLFEDRPRANDAWDIDYNFENKAWEPAPAKTFEIVEQGPVRVVLRVERHTEKSVILQDIIVYRHTARVDFVTKVDWHEKRTLLKVAFPVSVRSQKATYEIQFSAIERSTHGNTDWDRARFEVTGHKWADLSEGDFGVSLLNDCKYGYDVRGNVLRLSLLRSPISPDPHADEGEHEFIYAILPHAGTWRTETVKEAFELNVPLRSSLVANHGGGSLPNVYAFAFVDVDHVILNTVKRCEDSDEIVVRLYEAHGTRGPVTVTFANPIKRAVECDLMEENEQPVEWNKYSIRFYAKPFEIRTFKVAFESLY